ncbi:MAG: YraN family protein [Bacillota bacterium]
MAEYRKRIGRAGESYAVELLKKNGYTIMDTNFNTRCGEIDVVAKENGYLVFVEVKTRTSRRFGTGVTAVTPRKKHHLIKAALLYIARFGLHHENCRFDLLALETTPEGEVLGQRLIRNAFEVSRRYRY